MGIMTMVHPATARLADARMPEVALLLGQAVPDPLRAVAETLGGEITDSYPFQVTWWPGASITVRYRCTIEGGQLPGSHDLVGVAGRIPDGALVVEADDGGRVGVWRVPHDPALPGLPAALDAVRTAELLADLGGSGHPVVTRLRAYRPGRRAVVAVTGGDESIYLKLVRPDKVADLHAAHRRLPADLPVPRSLGFSRELGIMALQALPGRTLRDALEDPGAELPKPQTVAELPSRLPAPTDHRARASIIERVPALARVVREAIPDLSTEVDRFVDRLGEEDVGDLTPVHGDFYEAQLLVDGPNIVGLLDVDTYGMGRAADDPGVMIGHLALWETMSSQPDRVQSYRRDLLEAWDALYDPKEVRRRAAATLLTLATGPFRVQTADWPGETRTRVALAHQWLDRAGR